VRRNLCNRFYYSILTGSSKKNLWFESLWEIDFSYIYILYCSLFWLKTTVWADLQPFFSSVVSRYDYIYYCLFSSDVHHPHIYAMHTMIADLYNVDILRLKSDYNAVIMKYFELEVNSLWYVYWTDFEIACLRSVRLFN